MHHFKDRLINHHISIVYNKSSTDNRLFITSLYQLKLRYLTIILLFIRMEAFRIFPSSWDVGS
jgi:hypothetical protein